MTWYLDRETGDVYEDDAQFTGQITTIESDADGQYVLGRDLSPVMRETFRSEAQMGQSPVLNQRAGEILMDMATSNWRFGTPP